MPIEGFDPDVWSLTMASFAGYHSRIQRRACLRTVSQEVSLGMQYSNYRRATLALTMPDYVCDNTRYYSNCLFACFLA
jgi:hypothetical protein